MPGAWDGEKVMQKSSIEDIIIFSNGDCGLREDFEEQDFDGRRGTYKVALFNSPLWVEKAKELGIEKEQTK